MPEEKTRTRSSRAVCRACLGLALAALAPGLALGGAVVSLGWDPSADPEVAGYCVYYGKASHKYLHKVLVGADTSVTLSNLVAGGTYYFAAATYDTNLLESPYSGEISFVVPLPRLLVSTNGDGTVYPALGGKGLSPGRPYTITAIAGRGQVFAGWTGDVTSSAPRLSLTLNSDLHLQANFIPNPFVPIQGAYSGLFAEADVVRHHSAGAFSIRVSPRGTYSGRIQIDGGSSGFSGQLDVQCQATQRLLVLGKPLLVEFHVDAAGKEGQIQGQVVDANGAWSAVLAGYRSSFDTRTNAAPWAGLYTVLLPGQSGDPALPCGDGFGTARIGANGLITLAATLPDGAKLSQSASLSQSGLWPMYVSLYGGHGCVLSWLMFTNGASDDFGGEWSWIKPADVRARYYPLGLANVAQAQGFRYVPPSPPAQPMLNLSQTTVSFTGGNLGADFTNSLVLGPYSRVSNAGPQPLLLTFSPATGLFAGRVTDLSSGSSFPFSGAVFQKLAAGYGLLLGSNQSSRVTLNGE